jgi:hypothetical protein
MRGLERLAQTSYTWRGPALDDPDRLPTILRIPLRDPLRNYGYKIVKRGGRRHAVVYSKSKSEKEPFRFDRKNDVIPETQHMSLEDLREAVKRYDERKGGANHNVGSAGGAEVQ